MPWRQSQIQLQDRVAHVIIDDRFALSAPIRELPCLNWFGAWFIGDAKVDEFVPKADEEVFQQVEKKLIEVCGRRANGWAVYCFRIISRGIAEYYFYSRDGSTLASVVGDLQEAFPGRRFESEAKDDVQWSEYTKYLGAAG